MMTQNAYRAFRSDVIQRNIQITQKNVRGIEESRPCVNVNVLSAIFDWKTEIIVERQQIINW